MTYAAAKRAGSWRLTARGKRVETFADTFWAQGRKGEAVRLELVSRFSSSAAFNDWRNLVTTISSRDSVIGLAPE